MSFTRALDKENQNELWCRTEFLVAGTNSSGQSLVSAEPSRSNKISWELIGNYIILADHCGKMIPGSKKRGGPLKSPLFIRMRTRTALPASPLLVFTGILQFLSNNLGFPACKTLHKNTSQPTCAEAVTKPSLPSGPEG